MTWDEMPEFNWCDICSHMKWGLSDPARAGYSKRTRGAHEREKLEEARAAMLDYGQRRKLD
eukprot:1460496-Pyramimonas_sp.AAC.1